MSRRKIDPPFEGEVMLRMWATVPLTSKTWVEAVEEMKTMKLDNVRLVPDDNVIDFRLDTIAVRNKEVLEDAGL